MYKKLILTAALAAASLSAFAGGYVTNTNQNVAFLRNPAQNAVIGVQGAYFNPAGIAFMNNGWHLALDIQTAVQRRYTTSTYEPLKYGIDNDGKGYKKYTGKTFVPVLPHLDLVYKHNNWFGSFHFGVVSGGGKAVYDQGLGSFEAPVAMIPALINTLSGAQAVSAYSADIALTGEQYNFAGQLNFGYKISKNWSVAAGVRLNYISNYYVGSLKNIQLQPTGGQMMPASAVLANVISQLTGGKVPAENVAPIASALVRRNLTPIRKTSPTRRSSQWITRPESSISQHVTNSTPRSVSRMTPRPTPPEFRSSMMTRSSLPTSLRA